MKKINKLFFLLVFAFIIVGLFVAFQNKINSYIFTSEITVSGSYKGTVRDTYVRLEKLETMFTYKVIDSVKIIDKKFSFKVKKDSAENYKLYFPTTHNVIPLVLGEQDVSVKDIRLPEKVRIVWYFRKKVLFLQLWKE